jgi:outer membrane lipoprotein-sorting protein
VPSAGDATEAYASALGRRGVAVTEATLGRFDGRVAYVVGGRAKDAKPLAWVDKETFQPLRLQAQDAGATWDVRLLGWGSPTGGDWFPRALEAWDGPTLRLRFTTEKATANPRLPEPLFP